MEDLLFRAWHHNRKIMYQVAALYFATHESMKQNAQDALVIVYSKLDGSDTSTEKGGLCDVMQWSGKTDTLGKKIFESDYCLYKGKVGIVIKDKDRWTLVYKEMLIGQEMPLSMLSGKDLKVIGNIYEGEETND